jgi:hypothetical protein
MTAAEDKRGAGTPGATATDGAAAAVGRSAAGTAPRAGAGGAGRRSFARGLRQRNPLVLVAALALLAPALLGVNYLFTSGAWTAIPLKYWTAHKFDSFSYISWHTGALKLDPPNKPLITIVGGSNARESIWSGEELAAAIEEEGGPDVDGQSLAGPHQTLGGSLAVIENLPDTPTTVIVGINLLRLDDTLRQNLKQVSGRELLLESDTLRAIANERYGRRKYPPTILPGVFQTVTTRLSVFSDALLHGRALLGHYDLHSTDSKPPLTKKQKQAIERWANGPARMKALEKNLPTSMELLEAMLKSADERGIDVVLVELPHNPGLTGEGFKEAQEYYRGPLEKLAAEYDVAYIDFADDIGLRASDFHDLDHLLPSGRTLWQERLALELARLYETGAIEGAPGEQGDEPTQ